MRRREIVKDTRERERKERRTEMYVIIIKVFKPEQGAGRGERRRRAER